LLLKDLHGCPFDSSIAGQHTLLMLTAASRCVPVFQFSNLFVFNCCFLGTILES